MHRNQCAQQESEQQEPSSTQIDPEEKCHQGWYQLKTLLAQSQDAKNGWPQQSQSTQYKPTPPQLYQQQESQPPRTGDNIQCKMQKRKIKNKMLKHIPQQRLQEPVPVCSPGCTYDSGVNAQVESKRQIPPEQLEAQDQSSYRSIASRPVIYTLTQIPHLTPISRKQNPHGLKPNSSDHEIISSNILGTIQPI